MSTRDPYAPLFVAYWYWETLDGCNIPLLRISPVTLIGSGQCLEIREFSLRFSFLFFFGLSRLVTSEGEWGGTVGIATWTSRIALGCEVIMMTTTEAWGLPMT
ncbi:hypothetical protein JOM56_008230 [Amanita muscaria]